MSVLDTPRILFRGRMTWDPIVMGDHPVGPQDPGWNAHGTHRSVLFGAEVTGVDLGDGVTRDDAVVGVPLSFTGMLVDADPDASTSSQLFYDTFTVGVDGGCQVVLTGDRPFCARRLNPDRSPAAATVAGRASAVWQASVADAGFAVSAFDSVALDRLQEEVEAGRADGLTVRFNAYGTERSSGPPGTAGGGFQPNPARSLVVGVVGLWRCGEPVSEPGDRTLVPVGATPVATASARVVGRRLAVDLANSVPEADATTKADLGPLEVQATTPDGTVVPLGTLAPDAYDRRAHEAGGGIVALPLDGAQAEAAATGTLRLLAGGRVVLREQELAAVATTPNLYLDEVEGGELDVRVLRRGRPVTEPTPVLVVRPGRADPVTVTTDDAGRATLPVDDPVGVGLWILLPHDGDPPPVPADLDTQAMGYATTRVLPRDAQLDALAPLWEAVHHHVLAHWKALAPCMDHWLDLDDEDDCTRLAPLIRQLTGAGNHDRYRYMPVTRDLTVGQRALLHRWCDAVTGAARARAAASPA